MRILVTGASGFVGGALLPRLAADGHELRALARDPGRVGFDVEVVKGDVVRGSGLARALKDIDVVYYLVHSMEPSTDGDFARNERVGAQNFTRAARKAGVGRIIYLGGLVPTDVPISPHLASRLAVERILLDTVPDSVALRASIVIAARSRSFRFLVRMIERVPVLALPLWREHRTQPIDGRDVVELLAQAASLPAAGGRSLDIAGPDVLRYGQLIERIAEAMILNRPRLALNTSGINPLSSRLSALVASEDYELIDPLMRGLGSDLLPRSDEAERIFDVHLHRFDAAVEHALAEWEELEPLAAR